MRDKKNRKLGIVIVGLGQNGVARISELKTYPWIDIKGGVDILPERARYVSETFGIPTSTKLSDFLSMKEVDAVHCAAITPVHAEITIASLRAGKHVFCEKPMALNHREGYAILKAEKESGKYVQVNFELRYSLIPRRIYEILSSGEIGKLNSIYCFSQRGGWGSTGGYRLDPKQSGGAIMECPIHKIDMLRWLGGDITTVQVFRSPTVLPKYPSTLVDNFTAIFHFKSGLTASMVVMHSCSAQNLSIPCDYEHREVWTARGHRESMCVIGTLGSLIWEGWEQRLLVFQYNVNTGNVDFKREENYSYIKGNLLSHDSAGHAADFYRRILNGEPPLQSAEDAWRSTAVALAAEKSVLTGKKETVTY